MFLPRVFHRGVEERFFARILVGVREGFLPTTIRVFGRAGTGKTVVMRSVFERFSKFKGDVAYVVKFYYVNLRGCRSVFSAANAVLSGLCGRKLPNNVGLDKVFDEAWSEVKALKSLGRRLFVFFILDEVDSVFLDKHFTPQSSFIVFFVLRLIWANLTFGFVWLPSRISPGFLMIWTRG